MRVILFILFFFLIADLSLGQINQDTVYFDKRWKNCIKEEAKYFRIIIRNDSIYNVSDYYLNGTLQMKGAYSSMNPEIKDGLFTWVRKNGLTYKSETYLNGRKNGKCIYYRWSGNKYFEETYLNDTLNGLFIGYKSDGSCSFIAEYSHGILDTSAASYVYRFFYSLSIQDSTCELLTKDNIFDKYSIDCFNTFKNGKPKCVTYVSLLKGITYDIEYFRKGDIRYKRELVDGSEHRQFFRRNKQFRREEGYTNNGKDIIIKNYFRNGAKKSETKLKDDKIEYPYYIWKRNGKKYKIEYYVDERRNKYLFFIRVTIGKEVKSICE